MSGFPRRVSRDTFGPELANIYPVENPESDIPASSFNAAFHQLAGLNAAHASRAIVVAEWSGSAMSVSYQAEAWNSNGDQAHPVVARTGIGVYTVTFASSYLDEEGTSISTQLLYAEAIAIGAVTAWANRKRAFAWVDTGSPLVVNVTTWDEASGVAADVKFKLEVA